MPVASLLALLVCAVLSGAAQADEVLSVESLRDADYMKGKQAFQGRCSACHTLAADSGDIAGPNLWQVFDRVAGDKAEFAFSETLKQAGFKWTPARLDAWLADPAGYLPGNIMGIPEPVPEADRANMLHFMLIETGAVDWPRPAAAFAAEQIDRSKPPSERFPSFWNHLMFNTTRYRWEETQSGESFRFDAYFMPDGSVRTDKKRIRGFWHINDKDFFCYALYGMPVGVGSMVECFPVSAMAIPRFSEELWTSRPMKGIQLHGGIQPGRPDWLEASAAQP